MTRFLLCVCLLVCVHSVISSQRPSNQKEWSEMVRNKVREIRVSRSVPDDTGIPVVDIQEHYSNAFRAVNNKARIQIPTDEEMDIEGQYIVLLQSDTSQAHLYDTINILQNADAQSSGKLVARHIKPIRTIAKGFTATLGNRVVGLVRYIIISVCYIINYYASIHLFIHLFIHLSIFPFVCLSIYLSIYLFFPCLNPLINVI